jgi:enamine deaminase RidA (YjgF/YER057c/UK114 family)
VAQKIVSVEGWPRPKGYSNGIISTGPALYIAGQIGWNAQGEFPEGGFLPQFDQALSNVVAVVTAAGGTAANIVKMTVYVTDLDAYRNGGAGIGEIWRKRMGKVFPAMALLGVAGLVEKKAPVDITPPTELPG